MTVATISLIVLVGLFMVISAWIWKVDKKDIYSCYSNFDHALMTFVFAPILAALVCLLGLILIGVIGLWLIPIGLFILAILMFVFWDELNEFLQSLEGDKKCG